MAADCPRCRRELDPFIPHMCGVYEPSWSQKPLSTSSKPPTSASSSPSSSEPCGSPSCSSCRCEPTPARTTAGIARISVPTMRDLVVHEDIRGNVRETFRASWFPSTPTIQQLVRSESKPKTLRGMHLHRRQWDLWHFVSGAALVRMSSADWEHDSFIRADAGSVIAIPPGIAHGFYTEDGCILLYALTEEYTGDDEFGFYPFDGLTEYSHPGWPTDHLGLVVSERDLRATRLEDFDW